MSRSTKSLIGVAALMLLAAQAGTADAKSTRAETAQARGMVKVHKAVRAPVRHEYENVAGFKGRVNDPLYAFAAEPVPSRMGPVITQWPMPNTVWW